MAQDHPVAARLREGVKRVGEAEPLIALGKGMGTVVDTAVDWYGKGRDMGRDAWRHMTGPGRRTGDIELPRSGRPARRARRPVTRRSR